MRNFFTLPNLLSLTRLGLGAAAMLAIAAGSRPALILAAVLIATGALTAIANSALTSLQTPSELGKSLAATCGAIFQLAVFLAFLIKGWMPLWAALCVYSCEIALPYLRSFAQQFEAKRPAKAFETIKGVAFWASQLAAVAIAAFVGPDFTVQGVPVLLTIFVVDAAIALAMLVVFLQVLVQAKRRMGASGR